VIWFRHQAKLNLSADAASETSMALFNSWIKGRTLGVYSVCLFASITLITIATILSGDFFGHPPWLMRVTRWLSENKEITTSLLVITTARVALLNLGALWFLNKIIESTITPRVIPIVFLISAIVGNVVSVLLFPNSLAFAATGGTMGLVGLQLVAQLLGYGNYPPRLGRLLFRGVLIAGLTGTLSVEYINNGTLIGGLLAGMGLGYLLIGQGLLFRFESLFKWLAPLSIGLICLIALVALLQIL
jgi:hypothetical protein